MDARVADAPSPADGRNEAVGLKAYLSGLAARLREVPPAWVRCELLALNPGPRFVRVELIEHDEGGGKLAQASGGCWPGVHRRVEEGFAALGLRLEPGTKVLVKLGARLDANFGFRVEVLDVDPAFSLGDLKAKAEAIRRRLREAGLWDANRALSRPPDFRRVAVVSPPGAAGLGDFRSTAERLARAGLVEFAFLEAAFQTREAPERIVGALRDLYRECRAGRFCAVALIRGGGAAADLAYLVDHKLAEAVCRMPVPVMTGIGHERDRTLLDEVACHACDTPSKVVEHIRATVVTAALAGEAAAEAIRARARAAMDRLAHGVLRAERDVGEGARDAVRAAEATVRSTMDGLRPDARRSLDHAARLADAAHEAARAQARALHGTAAAGVDGAAGAIARSTRDALRPLEAGLAGARAAVDAGLGPALDAARTGVGAAHEAAFAGACRVLDAAAAGTDRVRGLAEALDPRTVLGAGYAILRGARGTPLTDAARVAAAPVVHAELRDGAVALRPTPHEEDA